MKTRQLVICDNCNWYHFAVTMAFAVEEVRKFNEFYAAATPGTKKNYGGPARLDRDYMSCNSCGQYKFRLPVETDKPLGAGHTISPAVYPS